MPEAEGGFYWYIFGSSLMHQTAGITIADSRLVGAGYVPGRNYVDVSLCLTYKSFYETRSLSWKKGPAK